MHLAMTAASALPTPRARASGGAVAAERSASVSVTEAPAQAPTTPLPSTPAQPATPVQADFAGTVQPILEKHCRPCHFTGGVMYEKLPFDRGATIRELGEKLFTRIRNPEEQAVIRKFLARGNPSAPVLR